jgi:hypothetical protein
MDVKFKKVAFHKNEILFGHDSTPFITAVEHDGMQKAGMVLMRQVNLKGMNILNTWYF